MGISRRDILGGLSGGLTACAVLLPAGVARAEPDAQHQMLASLAGHWTVKQTLWLGEGEPKIDSGTADFAMVLNGRHLRQILRIDDGTGFEGLSFVGYDPGAGQMFTTWMDVNFPGMVVAYGGFDSAAKAWVLKGQLPDGAPVREVLTLIDAGHMSYEFYEAHAGTEKLMVRLEYSR